jgi:S1-C subfamily serine protease
MKSGRSSSERAARRVLRRRLAAAAGGLALAAALTLGPRAQAIPPPPPNPGDEPPAAPAPKNVAPVKRRAICPRCGYACDPEWHYCVACGWDMTRLVGSAEEERLQTVARGAVRLVIAGKRSRHATAFPYGETKLFVTNARNLVMENESYLKIMTFDNHEYPATVVGYDLPTGVGLIKVADVSIPPLQTAAAPAPPDSTWAVCYPVSYEDDLVKYLPVSLHRGQLTATGQSGTFLVSWESLLRTDHTIESGCSGGPLVDARGRVVGMILGSPDDGITYALPLDGMDAIVASLRAAEKPKRPYFGFGLVVPDERRRAKFGLDASATRPMIGYLTPGSPAEKAGFLPGDQLVAVGDARVSTVWDAGRRLLATMPGSAGVPLTILRGAAEKVLTVAPAERPARVLLAPIDEFEETLEANIQEVTDAASGKRSLTISDLVRGGRGERDHFKNGDTILEVDRRSVRTREAFNDVIRTRFKTTFDDKNSVDRLYASSYVVEIEVRTDWKDRVTHTYVNLFPDILAPPVY